tara:strand:- start:650 stop:937 length:288 start_codon:yes stop_codon:yes gene_type:complete
MKRNFNRRNNVQNTVDPNNISNSKVDFIKEQSQPQDPNNFCAMPPRPPPIDREEEKRQYIQTLINDYQTMLLNIRELRTEMRELGINPDRYNPPN